MSERAGSEEQRAGSVASSGELDDYQRARRRLVGMLVYVPPAVIGSLVVGRSAAAQQASCGPASCLPNQGACQPQTCGPRCSPRNP